jgi:beta-glucosidase
VTFPRSVGQVPIFYSMKNTGRPMDVKNKYTSKYLDESNDPLYPFGYGLSYTTFTYGDVKLSSKEITSNDSMTVTCTVTNSGSLAGEEVVQLYIRDMVGSVTRPLKELKGFEKIKLNPGESKTVTFKLTQHDISFYKRDMTFGTEPGRFVVFVGGNSRDTKQAEFILQ